jgi:mono/diheme cytochrome c family protein
MLPTPVLDEVADLNKQFRTLLKGSVWQNYMLLATQWPSDNQSKTDPNGAPAPTFLANTTLETYSQGLVPLASSSCMACHGNATTQHLPATPSDFTFILEKAQ